MNRKQRRKIRRIAGKIRGWILTAMAIMAAYLVLCGVGITEMPEWGPDWYPGADLHGCDRRGVADNVHGRKRSFR